MMAGERFDPLISFAAIERLVAKIYFRFSHLFLAQPALRDVSWPDLLLTTLISAWNP